jgi:hypothetical protein
LVLRISYKGEKTRDIEKVELDDLTLLSEFLSGKLLTEDTQPLKDRLPRLQELLGVKVEN